ncbi:actin binding [Striga hermonthica]|uniref:Formin-like protein n=1 Tax=Striga hermonthica TaxID=68872 RepID=A0A9N7NA29_STRHE|nr:actin binding [Striga hermonthica]
MALFRKLFYRKPPDGLLEICERVYVFDSCFTTDTVADQDYKGYVGGIITQLKEHYPDASILAFNFREGEVQSQIANALSDYDMTIMEYPRQYEGCPLLPMEVIHHFLRSSESWLSLGLQNLLLMHCEHGGWAVLAFMLAALLIYRKHYSGELKTLDMVYRQAPRELLHLLYPVNPMPSQLRYLQYVSRRNVATEWPPLDRDLTMDCVIIRTIPNFDGEGGCRPIFRIYGQDPRQVSDRTPKVLFSTPKKSRTVRHYKQAECELVKIDIDCHIQGDVVLECICLLGDKDREVMMFRAMFNTAFIRSNILMLNRDEIDISWDAKDLFPKEFRAEVLFSEMDSVSSVTPVDSSCFEEKDGLPVEAFAKVQEFFNSVDWLVPKGDATVEVLQQISVEAYSQTETYQVNQSLAALGVTTVAKSTPGLPLENRSNFLPEMSGSTDMDRKQDDPHSQNVTIPSPKPSLIPPVDLSSLPSSLLPHQLSISQSNSIAQQSKADTSHSRISPSTPALPPAKIADVGNRQHPSTLEATSLAPPLGDRVSAQTGVSAQPLLAPEVPSVSTTPLKEDSASGSPRISHNKFVRVRLSQLDSPHSTEDAVGGTKVATSPPPPPPPPLSPHTTQSPVLNVIEGPGRQSPPHISSLETDITRKTVPYPPPPPTPPYATRIQEISSDSSAPIPVGPVVLPASHLNKNLDSEVQPSPPATFDTRLSESSGKRPSPPPPPVPRPPFEPPNEPSSVRGTPPSIIPPSPHLEKHSASGVIPPPPLTPPLKDNSVPRPAPPAPPPPPPPPTRPTKEIPSGTESPLAPTPPLCGPPLPPPPPPPHSSQSAGPTNSVILPSPPPPPNPGLSTSGPPSVPFAPPPPLLSPREPVSLSNSVPSSSNKGTSMPGSPSPPPPSTPPLGAAGKSLLSRTQTSRSQSKKLKPLHWLKLSRAVSGSLWAETQKSEASRAPEIDISELESLFSAAVPNADQGGSGRKTGTLGSVGKPEKVQLIEHRRAYNCEIMLSKVKIPLHDMLSSVLALEDTALDVDQVDNLIKFCPTKEEMDLLKGYKGERDKLGKCEQFFLELMQVPRIEYKLRVFSFKIQFHSQVSDLRKSLNVVNSAADQIRGSAKLKRIMQTILSLGNALNQGTARGSAIGFRLDSLLKLTETRARNNKMTLMHYLCKVLSDKLPELLDFWNDLSSLEPASKIQLKYLAEEMQAINKGLEKVMQELSMSESDGPVSDHFRKALKEFLCFSEGEVRCLASLYAGVGRNVDSLILYFGEDPARCPFEQVISTLFNFVRMFKKAQEENCKQLEFERKKAEKEASEKMKMNAADAGHLLQVKSVK